MVPNRCADGRYAPSILLLRNFEVFGKLQSNDGSPSDQVGAVSEIAAVVREFTEPLPEEQTGPPGHASKDGLVSCRSHFFLSRFLASSHFLFF